MVVNVSQGEGGAFRACGRRQTETATSPAWIDSRVLFEGKNEVLIRHGDQTYRLRITKQGKLLLNK